MGVITTRTFTRPDASIPWHFEVIEQNQEFLKILTERYMNTEKIIHRYVSFSDLVMTVNIYWDSIQSYNEHNADPDFQEYFRLRDAYNTALNITDTVEISEI